MTAKMVIASADRLMELRQFWRKIKRTAEISVPAWPIPTHHTKSVISHAQPTVLFSPQAPIPVQNVYPTLITHNIAPHAATIKPIHQALLGLFSTGSKISSVICAYVMSLPVTNGSLNIDSLCDDIVVLFQIKNKIMLQMCF